MKKLLFIIMCLLLKMQCFANDEKEESNIRISSLIPDLIDRIAINPFIPEDFVAMSPNGRVNPHEWIYWGPKDVLEKYFKDGSSLSQPIIKVKLAFASQREFDNLNEKDLLLPPLESVKI